MNRRVRTICRSSSSSPPSKREDGFNKYLKPGALAQLRDSRISAKSHRPTQISLYRFNTVTPSTTNGTNNLQITQIGFPCFTGRIFSPRCPQRKKLVAAKSFYFSPSSPVSDSSPDSLMDLLNSDLLVAH